ncbi:hypothetical protein ACF0H5_001456 [Mactra antiquata]
MVEQNNMNLLFFFGVLIPALVTIALFVVFCYCWYKMRIRNQILYKKHDPHKIERLRQEGKDYEPPPPPPPPFKSGMVLLSDVLANNNNNKNKDNDNYEESPEPTEGFDNHAMYRTNPDSGFSDLNQVQCSVENSAQVQRNNNDRPNSQASDDSDDSGFRSSRSGQYIHSASSSTGNAQENCGQGGSGGVHSLQVSDAVPLFKPIKIHPNDGRPPSVSFVNRNSSKYKNRPRKPLPSSQHYNIGKSESQNTSNINIISSSQQHSMDFMPSTSHFRPNMGQSYNSQQYISKSIGDVHGGRLHSIDSHVGPVTYAGHYGSNLCSPGCTAGCTKQDFTQSLLDRPFNQPDSIGYGSDVHSFGPVPSIGYIGPVTDKGQIQQEQLCYQHPMNTQLPICHPTIGSQIPGYTITSSSHMRPIKPDNGLYGIRTPMSSLPESSQPLTITQAMVHKPYIEELSDPTLYSVV